VGQREKLVAGHSARPLNVVMSTLVALRARTSARRPVTKAVLSISAALLVAAISAAPSLAAAAPSVGPVFTSGLNASSVELHASVNPNGLDTTYRFEYGATVAYDASVPVPDADIGEGEEPVAVTQSVEGLVAGTAYHFRIVAHNTSGTMESTDHTFVYDTSKPSSDGCANAALRTGFSEYLADCRAYELVSGPGIEPYFNTTGRTGNVGPGGPVIGEGFGVEGSSDGDRLGYFSLFSPPADSVSDGPYFLATRGEGGWTSENVVPPQSTTNSGRTCFNAFVEKYSPDFSSSVFADGWGQEGHPFGTTENNCGTDEPALVAGEPIGFQNLFLRDTATAGYALLNTTPPGVTPDHAFYQAASEDLSHVVFDEEAQLTPEAPAGDDLYVSLGGAVRLVTFLPDGTPVQGALANGDIADLHVSPGPGAEQFTHAVSADGSRIFFTSGGNLYVRERADRQQSALESGHCIDQAAACTLQIDASQTGGPGGGGTFSWASTDGSRVFFTDTADLTGDATAEAGEPDLYEYDFEAPEGARLTDLTVTSGPEHANVQSVVGLNETGPAGGYVYFVANGVLTTTPNSNGDAATPGQPNLYLRHARATKFIATLDAGGDVLDWKQTELTTRTSPSGVFAAFNSVRSLTGYDNTDASTAEPDQEIFLYDAAAERLSCASCNPSGALPRAPARIHPPVTAEVFYSTPGNMQRFVAEDGRVFFDTRDPLLPSATNGLSNVYQYQAGQLSLISSGSLGAPSYFYEASVSGDDVFFFTSEPLLSAASSGGIHVYDARVGGGFSSPGSSPSCEGEACKGAPGVIPATLTPGSSTLFGSGNPSGGGGATVAKASVAIKKIVAKGSALTISISASGRGSITVSGANVQTAKRTATKAQTFQIAMKLTKQAVRRLRSKHKLKLSVRVTFVPSGGKSVTVTRSVTLKLRKAK
jgi:hypothetical protein